MLTQACANLNNQLRLMSNLIISEYSPSEAIVDDFARKRLNKYYNSNGRIRCIPILCLDVSEYQRRNLEYFSQAQLCKSFPIKV